MAQILNSFGFHTRNVTDTDTNTNLGNADLSLDSGTAERTYTMTDNDLVFKNNGSEMFKISAQEGEITIGGSSASTILFKSGTSAPDIRIFEASGSGSNYVTLTCAALASNTTLTLPNTTGTIALTSQITANTNIANTDLTLDTTRELDLNDNDLSITNGGAGSEAIKFSGADQEVTIGSGDLDVIIDSSSNFSVDCRANISKRKLQKTGTIDGDINGDLVYLSGITTSVTKGKIYYFSGTAWVLADADAASSGSKMLAVAAGTGTASSVGMCVRGMATLANDAGTIGDIIYLSTTAGEGTSTAPSGSGDIVRIIGYCMDSTNGQIFFNPDNSFVELA